MKTKIIFSWILAVFFFVSGSGFSTCLAGVSDGRAFEGRIGVSVTQGNQTEDLLYTVGTNFLRVELTATNRPTPADIWDRTADQLILIFPHNRSFMRVKSGKPPVGTAPGEMPAMPQVPRGMPLMPPAPMEKLELHNTSEKTNILGFPCDHYQIKQRGETMEIWTTEELGPFERYVRSQPVGVSPPTIEERWGELLKAKGAFPLLAILKRESGMERFRFEVKSVSPQNLAADSAKLFQPPAGYREVLPLSF